MNRADVIPYSTGQRCMFVLYSIFLSERSKTLPSAERIPGHTHFILLQAIGNVYGSAKVNIMNMYGVPWLVMETPAPMGFLKM